jgi:hypothetical protein
MGGGATAFALVCCVALFILHAFGVPLVREVGGFAVGWFWADEMFKVVRESRSLT